jgi:2-dehydro-3-deoxyphosphooctonate aldolase (KDO 8-P synthase)
MTNLYEQLRSKPFLIAGPCVIESEEIVMEIAEKSQKIADELGFFYIFKASFDKANRTSADSYRGGGIEAGLRLLDKVKKRFGVPITTDIHESYQAAQVAEIVDILQIPAFLCRQTDLLLAAGNTGRVVNIKKAQFLSGKDMIYPCKKVESTGNQQIMLTERGNAYGNNDLVVDFRNVLDMKEHGYPLVMDATHSAQKPGGAGGKSGGNSFYAPHFACAAATMGVRGFFFETHPEPEKALSDGPNMIRLDQFKAVLQRVKRHLDEN